MKYCDIDQWEHTKDVIVGLYPKWNLTDEQAEAFKGEFKPLWQPALREAVRRLWLEDKFGGGTLNPGRLKAMYGRIRAENEAVAQSHDPEPEDDHDWDSIQQSNENILRRVLMAPVSAVAVAADAIRRGLGRWGWIKPEKNGGNDPCQWSTMMRAAVMFEIENPSSSGSATEGATTDDDSDTSESGGILPEAGGLADHYRGDHGDGEDEGKDS